MSKKNLTITLTAVLLTLLITNWAWGFPTGMTGYSGDPATGNRTCSFCHSGGIVPTVTFQGPTLVLPNTLATYTLTIAGGQEVAGGFNISATDGVLDVLSGATDSQKLGEELTHTAPKAVDQHGRVHFSFQWQAPATSGQIILYGAGNSVDNMNGHLGDAAQATTLSIQVANSFESIYLPLIIQPNQE